MPDPCRCWNDVGPNPHAGHCCFAEDTTELDDIGPTTPTSCGHFVTDSYMANCQADWCARGKPKRQVVTHRIVFDDAQRTAHIETDVRNG